MDESDTAVIDNMRPDWHLDQFSSVEDQAKAYVDLNKSLGEKGTQIGQLKEANESMAGYFGAPDDGYSPPEVEGVEFQPDDPLMLSFNEFAKENNYSNDHYQKALGMYAQAQASIAEQQEEEYKSELSQLENADKRISNINDWISANVPEDHQDGFADIATSAKAVEAIEWLLDNKAGKAPSSPSESGSVPIMSMAEIEAMQMATDEHGNRKMQNPEYAKRVNRLYQQHVGSGDYKQSVG